MRRRLVRRARRVAFGFLKPLLQSSDLARQPVDLNPLRGDRLVQRLDGHILIGQPHFQRVDALVQCVDIIHGSHR
jgi:hypothetical protein